MIRTKEERNLFPINDKDFIAKGYYIKVFLVSQHWYDATDYITGWIRILKKKRDIKYNNRIIVDMQKCRYATRKEKQDFKRIMCDSLDWL